MLPLVTAICPTANRRAYLPDAIRYFQAQAYPHKQLLIVDDGDQPVSDLIPDDDRIDYIRLQGKRNIGTKRNLCCARSAGEIICHWDDDDAFAPNRIEDQVNRLIQSGAQITGYNTMYFVDESLNRAWQYRGSANYPIGVSLCYWRKFWEKNPFPTDVEYGEDNHFKDAAHTIAINSGERFIAARIHDTNTCPKRATLRDAVWSGAHGEMWREIGQEELKACGYPWK